MSGLPHLRLSQSLPSALATLLALLLAQRSLADAPGAPVVLSRQNLALSGTLPVGGSASYVVDYQPRLEGGAHPAPWLLRMTYSAPGAIPNSIGFTWQDQTNAAPGSVTTGGMGRSTMPQTGGNITDVPPGIDPGSVQQAMLAGAASGSFAITVTNVSAVAVSYTLRLLPLLDGKLEAGIDPNATPVAAPTPTPSPPGPAPTASPVVAPPGQSSSVSVDERAFSPYTVTIRVGQAVTWTNRGAQIHTVTADEGAWDSGAIDPGKTFTRVFQAPGNYTYHSETDVTYNADGSKNILLRGAVVVVG